MDNLESGPRTPSPAGDRLVVELLEVGTRPIRLFSLPGIEVAQGTDVAAIVTHIVPGAPPDALLDLTGITKVAGPFFGELLKLMKMVKTAGGTLRLCCVSPPLRDVLRVTRMERLFEVYESREKALAAWSAT